MSRLILLSIVPLAACRAPRAPGAGDFVPPPHYAALFRPYEHWTYNAGAPAATDAPSGADAPATGAVVKCRADEVKPFRGGVTSHIACTVPETILDETGAYPLDGVWMANDTGLWHVRTGAAPTLDNATLVIMARPHEGHVDPDELTSDDEFADVARDGDAWCVTHQQRADTDETYFTLCFAPEGVRSGKYGYHPRSGDGATHETRFELAR